MADLTGRKAVLSLSFNGKNMKQSLTDYITSFEYTDPATGESDSISITFQNINKYWLNKWYPRKGSRIRASVSLKDWEKVKTSKKIQFGTFTLDTFSFSGRPMTGKFSALSTPAAEAFKTTIRTKTWKSITIQAIAGEIAQRYNLGLVYDADNIKIGSIEQSDRGDSDFLYDICKNYGLGMKVFSNKIIIFDEERYEEKKSVLTLKETDFLSWDFQDTLIGTYTGGKIKYTDPNNDKDYTITVGDGSRILRVSEKADSLEDARRKVTAKVNEQNKMATTLNVTMVANPKVIATANVTITGMGKINGKYAINKVKHSVGKGYTMSVELRKIRKRIKG
nr:MAG TPA: tail protein [Caudoviricetes sp.]